MEVRVCGNQSDEHFTSNSTVFRERAEMGQSSTWRHQQAVWSSPPLGASLPDPSRRLRHKPDTTAWGLLPGERRQELLKNTPAHRPPAVVPRSQILGSGHGAWRRGGRHVFCMWRRGQEGRGRQKASFVHTSHICPSWACPGGLPPASPGVRRWGVAGAPCGAVAKSLHRSFLCSVLHQSQAPGGETLRRGQPGLQLT